MTKNMTDATGAITKLLPTELFFWISTAAVGLNTARRLILFCLEKKFDKGAAYAFFKQSHLSCVFKENENDKETVS